MAKVKPQKWGKQVFLNEAHSNDTGAVIASTSYTPGGKEPFLESEVMVWDCNRKVILDFSVRQGEATVAARRRKVLKLQKVVNEFTDHYLELLATYEQELKRGNEK